MPISRVPRGDLIRRRRELRTQRRRAHQGALQWLVRFAQTPIADRSRRGVERQREELNAFLGVRFSGLTVDALSKTRTRVRGIGAGRIAAIQRDVAAIFERLFPHDPAWPSQAARLTPRQTGLLLTRVVGTGEIARTIVTRWPHSFWWLVVLLLEQYGQQIGRCMGRTGSRRCGRLFVRKRRQTFCSQQCARRELARRWYERNRREAQRRRRAAYARQKVAAPDRFWSGT